MERCKTCASAAQSQLLTTWIVEGECRTCWEARVLREDGIVDSLL